MTDACSDEILRRYREFTGLVDGLCADLSDRYRDRMACRLGCSECCTAITVQPIEAAAIADWTAASGQPIEPARADGQESCAFLRGGACAVYAARPLICRTHGLPLLYLIEEYELDGRPAAAESPEWRIAWCELNFTGVDDDELERLFEPGTVLNMEELNRRLAGLNAEFLATPRGAAWKSGARVELGR